MSTLADTPATPAPAERRTRPFAPVLVIAIITLQALFVLCFAYPPLRAAPHELPVGLAGPATATQELADQLAGGDDFDVSTYATSAEAADAIRDREIYGAIVVDGAGQLLVARAASPAVADMLARIAQQSEPGRDVEVVDVVPTARGDSRGVALTAGLLPLLLTSAAAGMAIAIVERRRTHRVGAVLALSILAGVVAAGILQGGLDALDGFSWANAGVIAALVLAISAASLGLTHALGIGGFVLLVLTLLFIGNPGSGAQNAPELLPEPWRTLGPYLPTGAGVTALRGSAFFDGAGTAIPLAILGTWAIGGFALLLLPGRALPEPAHGLLRVLASRRSAAVSESMS